jgi:hypothetical protein
VPVGISQGISAFQALLGFGYFAFVIGVSGSTFYARINNKMEQEQAHGNMR